MKKQISKRFKKTKKPMTITVSFRIPSYWKDQLDPKFDLAEYLRSKIREIL